MSKIRSVGRPITAWFPLTTIGLCSNFGYLAISSISFSQESSIEDNKIIEEYTFRTKSYEKKDGYVIKNYHTSLVDNYGTLWVGGTVDKSSVNQFNKEFIGLYFFNGTKFQ